jgi:hypothetical protein
MESRAFLLVFYIRSRTSFRKHLDDLWSVLCHVRMNQSFESPACLSGQLDHCHIVDCVLLLLHYLKSQSNTKNRIRHSEYATENRPAIQCWVIVPE